MSVSDSGLVSLTLVLLSEDLLWDWANQLVRRSGKQHSLCCQAVSREMEIARHSIWGRANILWGKLLLYIYISLCLRVCPYPDSFLTNWRIFIKRLLDVTLKFPSGFYFFLGLGMLVVTLIYIYIHTHSGLFVHLFFLVLCFQFCALHNISTAVVQTCEVETTILLLTVWRRNVMSCQSFEQYA